MKKSDKKKMAWTLAELGVAFFVLSVIMSISLSSFNKTAQDSNTKLYYSALKTAMKMTGEAIAGGKTDASGNLIGDYYGNVVNTVNTIGATSATSSTPPTYTTPNFTLSNGMRFYGLSSDFTTNPKVVYVDVNGTSGQSKDPTQNPKNPDIFRINIYKTGFVEPYTAGSAVEGTMILSKITVWGRVDGSTTALAGCTATTTGQNYPCIYSKNMTYNNASTWLNANSSTYNATIEYLPPKML